MYYLLFDEGYIDSVSYEDSEGMGRRKFLDRPYTLNLFSDLCEQIDTLRVVPVFNLLLDRIPECLLHRAFYLSLQPENIGDYFQII